MVRVRLSPGAAFEGRESRLSARLCAGRMATRSTERAEFVVRAPVSACARSDRSGSIAETSNTAISLPSTPKMGAPEQLRSVCRERKCWFL